MSTLKLATIDCDDFMLYLARASHHTRSSKEEEYLDRHGVECEECAELSRQLDEDGDDDTEDGVAPSPDDLLGRTIGAYTIKELVGAGGMGRVYLALHPEIGSRVAIKVFSKDWNTRPELVARFFAEARATNVIAHENIVNVLDVGRLEDDRPYMIMEFLTGSPLSRLVSTNSLDDSQIRQTMLDVLSALDAAHDSNIIHRDLKPDNIFVSPEGRATLLDFGIAKLVPELVGDSAPTATGTILGTPHYMSPEQAIGDPIDARTDVYAMGIILYECFTGQRPFRGNSLYRLLDQHINQAPTRPRSVRPELGQDIEDIILKAMGKTPDDRYTSIAEMRAVLESCPSLLSGAHRNHRPNSTLTPPPPDTNAGATANTVAASPKAMESVSVPEGSRAIALWIGAGVTALAASLTVVLLVRSSGGASSASSGLGLEDATVLSHQATDAAVPTDAPPLPRPLNILDAGMPMMASDAAVVPTITTRQLPTPSLTVNKGTRPLSLLQTANGHAISSRSDAVLLRVWATGLNTGGRVELGKPGRSIRFDYYSQSRAMKVTRKFGPCVVRVTFTTGKNPTVEQKTDRCSTLRPIPAPRCSMKKLLQKGLQTTAYPALRKDQRVDARLQASRGSSGRPFWKITIDGRDYKMPGC